MANEAKDWVERNQNKITISAILFVVLPILFWMCFLNHIGINEFGLAYNSWSGQITIQDKPGWYLTSPLTFVSNFSTLPMKVTIPSNAAVINTKIVRFKKEGVEEYIRLQGFSWFDSSFESVLMGYAFSGKQYPFLEVMQEAGPETIPTGHKDWERVSGEKRTGKSGNEK